MTDNHVHSKLHRLAPMASAWPALAAALMACGPAAPAPATPAAPAEAEPAPAETAAEPAPEPAPARPAERGRAILHTTEGPIAIAFYADAAPRTVEHIVALMRAGCYDGIDVFRYEPDFVVQVSPVADPNCHPEAMSTVPAEFDAARHERLSLSLARFEAPDSGTSSWSILLRPTPSMDGQYTVFGRVVEGEDTIAKITAIGSTKGEDGMSRLNRKVAITRVELTGFDDPPAE